MFFRENLHGNTRISSGKRLTAHVTAVTRSRAVWRIQPLFQAPVTSLYRHTKETLPTRRTPCKLGQMPLRIKKRTRMSPSLQAIWWCKKHAYETEPLLLRFSLHPCFKGARRASTKLDYVTACQFIKYSDHRIGVFSPSQWDEHMQLRSYTVLH